MTATARGPYAAGTPETTTFDVHLSTSSLAEDVELSVLPKRSGLLSGFTTHRWGSSLENGYESIKVTIENNTGMLYVAASQAFFSLMNVAVKKLNTIDPPVPAFELILVRMGITWICCVTYMYFMKVPDPFLGPKGVRLLLVARGFVGFFGLFGIYSSLRYLSLSDATVLTFLAPMCTIVTGALFLKESFSFKEALAGLCSLCGVVLIARPEFLFGGAAHDAPPVVGISEGVVGLPEVVTPAQRLGAVGVALIGVCGATGAYTTIRAIGKRAHPLHNLVSFSSQCVIVATAAILVTRTPIVIPTRLDWVLMLFMIGIFGFIAQVLLTLGLQRETASRGTMAVYVQIIFATVLERIFFHTTPPPLSIIGTIIIITSAIYVAVTKESTTKKHVAVVDDISLEEGLLSHQEDPDPLILEDAKAADKNLSIIGPDTSEVVVNGNPNSFRSGIVAVGNSSLST